jgi:hypothetical protein
VWGVLLLLLVVVRRGGCVERERKRVGGEVKGRMGWWKQIIDLSAGLWRFGGRQGFLRAQRNNCRSTPQTHSNCSTLRGVFTWSYSIGQSHVHTLVY